MALRWKIAGWVLMASGTLVCGAQTTPAKGVDAGCIPGMKDAAGKICPPQGPAGKSTAEQFPYPGSDAGADVGGAGKKSDLPGAPDAPGKGSAGGSTAGKEFPYPGDSGSGAAPEAPGSSSSSSGESSSNPGGADQPKLNDVGSEGKKTRRAPAEKVQTPEEREAEDLKVAKFYENDGNLNGAYLRAKDAVEAQPDDSEAHFRLAEIAQKMKKKDEAAAEFQAYEKLDPDGLEIKKVKKALQELH